MSDRYQNVKGWKCLSILKVVCNMNFHYFLLTHTMDQANIHRIDISLVDHTNQEQCLWLCLPALHLPILIYNIFNTIIIIITHCYSTFQFMRTLIELHTVTLLDSKSSNYNIYDRKLMNASNLWFRKCKHCNLINHKASTCNRAVKTTGLKLWCFWSAGAGSSPSHDTCVL